MSRVFAPYLHSPVQHWAHLVCVPSCSLLRVKSAWLWVMQLLGPPFRIVHGQVQGRRGETRGREFTWGLCIPNFHRLAEALLPTSPTHPSQLFCSQVRLIGKDLYYTYGYPPFVRPFLPVICREWTHGV